MSTKPATIEETMAKKLALWHTRTFRPIITHEELEPIMAAAGFVPVPLPSAAPSHQAEAQEGRGRQHQQQQQVTAVQWREYASRSEAAVVATCGGKKRRRRKAALVLRPRLPYPRIDGLHLMTYKAFLLALEFHLGPTLVPNLFHVRSMSLSKMNDRAFEKAYRPMKDREMDDEGIIVYREGTLDHVTKLACSQYNGDHVHDCNGCSFASIISCADNYIKKANGDDGIKGAVSLSCLVPLEELFPTSTSSSRDIISLR